MINALKAAILKALFAHPHGMSEYELLCAVEDLVNPIIDHSNASTTLFQKHFAIMHCLYQLQCEQWETHRHIVSISPLKISIAVSTKGKGETPMEVTDKGLRDYYLDWQYFESTDQREVDKLLGNFWRDYTQYIHGDEAWQVLSLPVNSDLTTVTARYRELAAIHHPDRGGSPENFIKIRAAYESLRITLKGK